MSPPSALLLAATHLCSTRGWSVINPSGEGAFKATFKIRRTDGHFLALKVYRQTGISERTEREIDALKRCTHESLPRLQEFGTFRLGDGNVIFSTEEFLAGGTLTQKLASKLSLHSTADIGTGLIKALAYISDLQLVHRDIKPDNIMFREDGQKPVLVDFGLVRDLRKESLTQSWAHRGPGTPIFASPEQLNNEKFQIDWRSDQFSLGIVLSLCITGLHPFQWSGDAWDKVVDRMASRGPISPEFARLVQPFNLPVLKRMLGGWPIERYRDPAALLADWDSQTCSQRS